MERQERNGDGLGTALTALAAGTAVATVATFSPPTPLLWGKNDHSGNQIFYERGLIFCTSMVPWVLPLLRAFTDTE